MQAGKRVKCQEESIRLSERGKRLFTGRCFFSPFSLDEQRKGYKNDREST